MKIQCEYSWWGDNLYGIKILRFLSSNSLLFLRFSESSPSNRKEERENKGSHVIIWQITAGSIMLHLALNFTDKVICPPVITKRSLEMYSNMWLEEFWISQLLFDIMPDILVKDKVKKWKLKEWKRLST